MAFNAIKDFQYVAIIHDANGDVVGVYNSFTKFQYKKLLSKVGMAIVTVPEGHDILSRVGRDSLLICRLGIPIEPQYLGAGFNNQVWMNDFSGIFRDRQIVTDANGDVYHVLYFPSVDEILTRYVTGYPTGLSDRSLFHQDIGTIFDYINRYNASVQWTLTTGRIRDVTVVHGLLPGGPGPIGTIIDYSVAPGRPLLDVLQELAKLGGFDFYVDANGYTLSVQAVTPTDRTGDIVFSLNLGSASAMGLDFGGTNEKTAIIVGGAGDGVARTFVTRTGPNYAADNDYEFFVNASDKDDAELAAIGDVRAEQMIARAEVSVNVVASRRIMYRRDFEMGDLVTVIFAGFAQIKKISGVSVIFDQEQKPSISLEMIAV